MKPFLILLLVTAAFTSALGDTCNCNLTQATSICANLVNNALLTYPNYASLRTPDLITQLGYPVETHTATTEDHYILTMYRISHSTASPGTSGKVPVYLMHGVLASSVQWLWQPTNRALVFMLVDAGFDVWIGNARGTSYSQGHVTLSSSNLAYWDFSFHEMGYYDLPAAVNYITTVTQQSSLYYVGHSLGTTQFFAGVSLRPELQSKIRTMFSLATSGYIGHLTNPFFRGSSPVMSIYLTEQIVNTVGGGQFVPQLLQQYIGNFTAYCTTYTIDCGLCNTVFGLLFGIDLCQTDYSQLPGVLAHLPDTTSTKTFSHIAQDVAGLTFRQYDYGVLNNPSHYSGSTTPPNYNWSNVNVPIVIYYGDNDNLAVPQDVQLTAAALGQNVKELNRIPCPNWNHMDSVLGKDADIYINQPMIQIMKSQKYG